MSTLTRSQSEVLPAPIHRHRPVAETRVESVAVAKKPRLAPAAWRFEFKYLAPAHVRSALVADLRAFCEKDDHAPRDGFYGVRSVYFDSPDWACFHEKCDGTAVRRKLRLRRYVDGDSESDFVKFEIKHKHGNRVLKEAATVGREMFETLTTFLHPARSRFDLSPMGCEALNRFFQLKSLSAQSPVMTIEYRRQAFRARFDRSVRVTIDDRIAASRQIDPFRTPRPAWRVLDTAWTVVEIKVADLLPLWTRRLIEKYRLIPQTVSKYALSAATGPFGLDGVF